MLFSEKDKKTISSNAIIQNPQNLNSKHNLIIGTYFHGQNVEKLKKDKIVALCFPRFFSFHHLSLQEETEFLKYLCSVAY